MTRSRWNIGGVAAASYRTLAKAAMLEKPIVKHQRTSYRQIEGEPCGDPHYVLAALQHRR